VCVCVCVNIYTYIYMYTYFWNEDVVKALLNAGARKVHVYFVCVYIYVFVLINMYTYICIHIHIYIHMYEYTYIYIYIYNRDEETVLAYVYTHTHMCMHDTISKFYLCLIIHIYICIDDPATDGKTAIELAVAGKHGGVLRHIIIICTLYAHTHIYTYIHNTIYKYTISLVMCIYILGDPAADGKTAIELAVAGKHGGVLRRMMQTNSR